MELAYQIRVRRLVLRAHWLPSLENEEADALTNFDFRHFKDESRIHVKLEDLKFAVLDDLFKTGEGYVAALEKLQAHTKALKEAEGHQAPARKKHKKLKGGGHEKREHLSEARILEIFEEIAMSKWHCRGTPKWTHKLSRHFQSWRREKHVSHLPPLGLHLLPLLERWRDIVVGIIVVPNAAHLLDI